MRAQWMVALALVVPFAAGASTPSAPETITIAASPNGIALETLLIQAQRLAGGSWLFEPSQLRDQRVFLAGDVELPAERFLGFFEQCLAADDFVHVELHSGAMTTHRLMKLGQQARGQMIMKTIAPTVTLAELETLAERHTLVTTSLQSQHVAARELVTTLNLYFADAATESIRNIEGTDQIVMTGFSDNPGTQASAKGPTAGAPARRRSSTRTS